MRLFLDQMIERDIANTLQKDGFDAKSTFEMNMSKADDLEILEYCIKKKRILITLDEHFGDWTVIKLRKHPGVIRIKANPTTTRNIKKLLLPFLLRNQNNSFSNKLVIIKSTGIRWIDTDI